MIPYLVISPSIPRAIILHINEPRMWALARRIGIAGLDQVCRQKQATRSRQLTNEDSHSCQGMESERLAAASHGLCEVPCQQQVSQCAHPRRKHLLAKLGAQAMM